MKTNNGIRWTKDIVEFKNGDLGVIEEFLTNNQYKVSIME
jgi:uncharacterized protein YkvS